MARLKFPAPATMETWVTGQDGDPVFMVVAEPSDSLAGELRRLLPDLRGIVGQGRRVTVCFDRGGWSPALFADITGAGFDLLTWRKGSLSIFLCKLGQSLSFCYITVDIFRRPGQTGTRSGNATANEFMAAFQPRVPVPRFPLARTSPSPSMWRPVIFLIPR